MSMRILPLNNISFKSNNVQAKESEKSPEEKSKGLSNSAKLGIGLLGSAALGVATYYIFKGKNLSGTTKSNINVEQVINNTLSGLKSDIEDLSSKYVQKLKNGGYKVQFSTPVEENKDVLQDVLLFDNAGNLQKRIISKFDATEKSITHKLYKGTPEQIIEKPNDIDPDCLVKEVMVENFEPFIKDSITRNVIIKKNDNTQIQYQEYYRKSKLYERSVYNEVIGNDSAIEVTRYNYAYENGKYAGEAKQSIYKDGNQHGVYKDGMFNPFPVLVKKRGEKDFSVAGDACTVEALYKFDSRFDPNNL